MSRGKRCGGPCRAPRPSERVRWGDLIPDTNGPALRRGAFFPETTLACGQAITDGYAGVMAGDGNDVGIDDVGADRVRRILLEFEDADFERVDPPADLWARIEASVSADQPTSPRRPHRRPKEPPVHEPGAGTVVEYWIDADDGLTEVGPGWADFARDNDAPELVVPAPARTIWSYFDRDDIRELWQLLVARVRSSQTAARVPLRCDAPHARRWFDLTISPEPGGRVHFRSVLAFEESRPPVTLLDPGCERDADARPVLLCNWCGQGRHDSEWLDIEHLVRRRRLLENESMPPISNGICETCRDDMSAELLVPGRVGESTD